MNIKILKTSIVLGAIIAIILSSENAFALSLRMPETRVRMKIEKEWKGYYCGYTEPVRLIIKTEEQWREVWGKLHRFQLPKPELPNIDFDKEMVIAAFMGQRNSGGYAIQIIKIVQTEKEIVVEFEEREPSRDSIRTMALTQPYHIVIIKKSHLAVRFQNL